MSQYKADCLSCQMIKLPMLPFKPTRICSFTPSSNKLLTRLAIQYPLPVTYSGNMQHCLECMLGDTSYHIKRGEGKLGLFGALRYSSRWCGLTIKYCRWPSKLFVNWFFMNNRFCIYGALTALKISRSIISPYFYRIHWINTHICGYILFQISVMNFTSNKCPLYQK